MPRFQERIRSLRDKVPRAKEFGQVETEDDGIKSILQSGFQKIVYAVRHWEPFPLRSHHVDDVNEVNKNVLLAMISFLMCTSFTLIWISVFIIDARRGYENASTDSFSSHILSFSAIVLVMSLISFTFTLCGFVGVFRENIILVRIFYIALIALLSLKLAIALFTFSFTGTAEQIVGGTVGDKLILNYRDSSDIEATMDYLQITFRCCGLREQGFKDWSRSIYYNCSDGNPSTERCGVPWSCCRNETGLNNALCGRNVQKVDRNLASRTIYTKGCIVAILEWAKNHAFLVAFLLLVDTLLLTVLIFQCTHLVNELQMMNGVYRGPWWVWIGESRLDERPSQPQEAQRWDERPIPALPFHLELAWHEAPFPADQPGTAADQRGPAADQRGPAVGQRGTTPTQPPASARHEQRRSTVGQRFFRAVMSRASRVANRRQAVADEEERRRCQDEQSTDGGWVVHHRDGGAGSVGPAGTASHTLERVGEEGELETAEVPMSPLQPIGSVHSTTSEVQGAIEEETVQQIEQSHDQTSGKERKKSIGDTKLLMRNRKVSVSPSDASPLPGLIVSQNQINISNVHSQQGASRELLKTVPKVSQEETSDGVSSVRHPCAGVARLEQPANKSDAEVLAGVGLAVKPGALKSPTSSRIALVLDAVENDASQASLDREELSPAPRATSDSALSPPQPTEAAPAELATAATTVSQRQSPVLMTSGTPSADADHPVEIGTVQSTATVSPHRTASTARPVVGGDDAVPQSAADGDTAPHGAIDGADIANVSPSAEESPEGHMTGSGHDHHRRRNVSDASTDTHPEKRKKDHRRKSRLHRKKKHKGHSLPTEETEPSGEAGAGKEPTPEWLRPTRPKTSDLQVANEATGSAYFSPSEFQHLAVQHSPNPAADGTDSAGSHRRGTVARAISMELHELIPGSNPESVARPQRPIAGDDDEHTPLAKAVSRKLHAILPSIHPSSERSAEPKPSTSTVPSRLLSAGTVEAAQQVTLQATTSRGLETFEQASPASSSPQLAETDSDTEQKS